MQVLILAAGYATRLYPLTLDKPKPLLPVAGKPMIEYIIDNLAGIPDLTDIFVVSNHKFAGQFEDWAHGYKGKRKTAKIKIVDDGSTSETDRLGAIGDMNLVIQREKIQGDLIVIAGDNLFSEPLQSFGNIASKLKQPLLGVYDVGSRDEAKKYGCVSVDSDNCVAFFEEKPKEPKSTLIAIALYYYPAEVVKMVETYLKEGNNADQPGRFVQWLYPTVPVFTWKVPGRWYDIGSKETLEEAGRIFSRR
jgi:glucose-1-phosphate thymidylyltransferase